MSKSKKVERVVSENSIIIGGCCSAFGDYCPIHGKNKKEAQEMFRKIVSEILTTPKS